MPSLPVLPTGPAPHHPAAGPAPLPSPSNPQSKIQNPKSETPDSPSPGRCQVPTTFNPIINDEANILAAISRGDRTISDLAEEYGTTVSNFALWLQREDTQKKLADLTTAGATLTRIAAVNQLPKAVSALSFQIDGYIADRCRNLIKPGLDAERVAATRDANVRKAAHLLLRLAKFDPNQPVYRRRERADRATLREARSPIPNGGAVEACSEAETEGALALGGPALRAGSSPLPPVLPTADIDILSLCAAALSAADHARVAPVPSNPVHESRTTEPDSPSDPGLDLALSIAAAEHSRLNNNGHHHNASGKHNGHSNGRLIRHTKPPDSPPKSRPPPT